MMLPFAAMQSETVQPMPLREARAEFDRVYLARLLETTGGDIARAAEIAEIHPKSFARLMRRYKMNRQ